MPSELTDLEAFCAHHPLPAIVTQNAPNQN